MRMFCTGEREQGHKGRVLVCARDGAVWVKIRDCSGISRGDAGLLIL